MLIADNFILNNRVGAKAITIFRLHVQAEITEKRAFGSLTAQAIASVLCHTCSSLSHYPNDMCSTLS